MELLLTILGAAFLGGFTLFDSESSDDSSDEDKLPGSMSDTTDIDTDNIQLPSEATAETTKVPSNPLAQAIGLEVQFPQEVIDQSTRVTEAVEHQEDSSNSDMIIYDGLSDEEMGYSNNSFGIAHRFYENDATAETLVGADGDDTIYVGAGSTVSGGGGADNFELFIPDNLLGQDVFVLTDFDPSEDTLTVLFEQNSEMPPEMSLTPNSLNGGLNLQVNGTTVAALNSIPDDTQIAVSNDGNGEEFFTLDGNKMSDVEANLAPIRISFLSSSVLYGY